MIIFGISPAHDSSVAVVEDGVVKAFLKEERIVRKKRELNPMRSLLIALEHYTPDAVVICPATNNDPSMYYLQRLIEKHVKCKIIIYNDTHHLTHASQAFYNSGFDTALCFVIDRNGSIVGDVCREAESVFSCAYPDKFEPLYKNHWVFNIGADADGRAFEYTNNLKKIAPYFNADRLMSIVKVYESATTLIGQDPLENGKVMGLSAYGSDKNFKKLFDDEDKPNDLLFTQQCFVLPDYATVLNRNHIDKQIKTVERDNFQFYADYAWHVQQETQRVVLNMVKKYVEQTGIYKVCVTGGYGLNVVSNENLIKNLPDVEFYFEPISDDTGNSIGGAMHYYRTVSRDMTINKMTTTFFHGIPTKLEPIGVECTVDDIVHLLVDQKVVAVYNGLAEAGPRALGNRSILFDARNKDAKEIVNKTKKREWYRPFAGMILKDKFQEYFETHGMKSAEYMTVSYQCKVPDKIPGVCHVDDSCRIQTVDENIPHIFSLLNKFNEKTGCPVILNTSFNLAGESLVESQQDAIDTFNNSDIDAVWFPEIGKVIMKGVK